MGLRTAFARAFFSTSGGCIAFDAEEVRNLAISFGRKGDSPNFRVEVDENKNQRWDGNRLLASAFSSMVPLSVPLGRGKYLMRQDSSGAFHAVFTPHCTASPIRDPGDTPRKAWDLGEPKGEPLGGYVGRGNGRDVYRFTASEPGTVAITVSDTAESPRFKVFQDRNGNETLEGSEQLRFGVGRPSRDSMPIEPGAYHLTVESNVATLCMLTVVFSENRVQGPDRNPGESARNAFDLGELSSREIGGCVGPAIAWVAVGAGVDRFRTRCLSEAQKVNSKTDTHLVDTAGRWRLAPKWAGSKSFGEGCWKRGSMSSGCVWLFCAATSGSRPRN